MILSMNNVSLFHFETVTDHDNFLAICCWNTVSCINIKKRLIIGLLRIGRERYFHFLLLLLLWVGTIQTHWACIYAWFTLGSQWRFPKNMRPQISSVPQFQDVYGNPYVLSQAPNSVVLNSRGQNLIRAPNRVLNPVNASVPAKNDFDSFPNLNRFGT